MIMQEMEAFKNSEAYKKVKEFLERKSKEMNNMSTIDHISPTAMFEIARRKGYLQALKRVINFFENGKTFEEDKDAT
jgi:hypothetical protein